MPAGLAVAVAEEVDEPRITLREGGEAALRPPGRLVQAVGREQRLGDQQIPVAAREVAGKHRGERLDVTLGSGDVLHDLRQAVAPRAPRESTPRPELGLVRPSCLGQLAVTGDPGLGEHVRVALDRAEERVPFAFELPVEESLGELARIGVRFAAGGEVELLEPFPDLTELAARVVDVLAGRLDPAKGVLAEGDDLGSVAAAEQLLDGGDDVFERLRESVRFVPGDEAARVHDNVEGMLELAEARCGVQARAGR